jgi:hypothetical protein
MHIEDTKVDHKETVYVEWIDLDQDRVQWQTLVNKVMNLWVP